MSKKILIMGLPQAGKTTLAKALAPLLRATHFNADDVRAHINRDLGFTLEDRVEQARRMGWLCDQVVKAGHCAVADFVCPTPATRAAFGDAYTVYLNTNRPTPYADTRNLFVPPEKVDYEVREQDAVYHAQAIAGHLAAGQSGFDWRKPTALFVGRYQPFHEGHKALVLEGLTRVGQACIAVRDVEGVDTRNPFGFAFIRERIQSMLADYLDHIAIISIPNITHIFYGRDVGYAVERIDLPHALQLISATNVRKQMEADGLLRAGQG
ncbi:MAG: adenylyl-sulfate kinase [Alphaproteobacteria bacterium]|nr:adenylyl-sulfate kinase [Alphaproteobacteria bacterium]